MVTRIAGLFCAAALACSAEAQTIGSVVNAASYTPTVAPGTWVAIYGNQLAPGALAATSAPFPTQLNGVTVTVNGIAAPISYVSPMQINALIPFESASITGLQTSSVTLAVNTRTGTASTKLTLAANAPAIFTKDSSGSGNALVFDPYFNPVSQVSTSPIVLYATGLGPTNPPASTNALGASAEPLNRLVSPLTVSIGGGNATVLYAGLAPGLHGIYQINAVPNPVVGGGLYVIAGDHLSGNLTVPVAGGTDVANVTGSIDSLYPTAASSPVSLSALLLAATFSTSFDLAPNAKPFNVVAQIVAGAAVFSATISINRAHNTWSANYLTVTTASREWNFSQAGAVVNDLFTGAPLPGNVFPASRVDPVATLAISALPLPTSPTATGFNTGYVTSGSLSGSHFAIGGGVQPQLANFGGFTNMAASLLSSGFPLTFSHGQNSLQVQLFVDNLLVASKSVSFAID